MSNSYYSQEDYEEVCDSIENEGLGYYIEHYTDGRYFQKDEELYAAFIKAQEGIKEFRNTLRSRLAYFKSDYAKTF